jgi:flagellin-like hook-associated protein FlgL
VSNIQLLITIGLPMLALAFGLYLNDRRFEGISTRIGDINARIDDLRTDLGGRITRVETSIDNLTSKLVDLDNRVVKIETKLGIG